MSFNINTSHKRFGVWNDIYNQMKECFPDRFPQLTKSIHKLLEYDILKKKYKGNHNFPATENIYFGSVWKQYTDNPVGFSLSYVTAIVFLKLSLPNISLTERFHSFNKVVFLCCSLNERYSSIEKFCRWVLNRYMKPLDTSGDIMLEKDHKANLPLLYYHQWDIMLKHKYKRARNYLVGERKLYYLSHIVPNDPRYLLPVFYLRDFTVATDHWDTFYYTWFELIDYCTSYMGDTILRFELLNYEDLMTPFIQSRFTQTLERVARIIQENKRVTNHFFVFTERHGDLVYKTWRAGLIPLDDLLHVFTDKALDASALAEGAIKAMLKSFEMADQTCADFVHTMIAIGASPIHITDKAGFVMVANVRSGIYTCEGRSRALKFTSTEDRLDILRHLEIARANWSPQSHIRFPKPFKQQVFTFLCINKRKRFLQKDTLYIVIKILADLTYATLDMEMQMAKDLLKTTYNATTDLELRKLYKTDRLKRYDFLNKSPKNTERVYSDETRDFMIENLCRKELGMQLLPYKDNLPSKRRRITR